MKRTRIFPVILAAGDSSHLGYPKALASFDGKTAIAIAVENCATLEPPIVVLGHRAARIRRAVPAGARVVVNRAWRKGQLSSLLAGLRLVPRGAPFLLYPVDQPLLDAKLMVRLVKAYATRSLRQRIVMPRFRRRAGHPILCSGILRRELQAARTAREVVYRDERRIRFVTVRSEAIWADFDSPSSYRRCLKLYRHLKN
ncbi:MAG: NTP transferase domain-containing protein [Candidatus Acidiferrales bacterium]